MESRSSADGGVGEPLQASSKTGTVHFQELFSISVVVTFRNRCASNTSIVFVTNVQKAASVRAALVSAAGPFSR